MGLRVRVPHPVPIELTYWKKVNRKQRRAAAKMAQKAGHDDLSKKIMLFNEIGDECTCCESPFDKTDAEMLNSWMVIVREEKNLVNIYCPECWERAREAIATLKKDGEVEREEE